jgi:hypothetical protein
VSNLSITNLRTGTPADPRKNHRLTSASVQLLRLLNSHEATAAPSPPSPGSALDTVDRAQPLCRSGSGLLASGAIYVKTLWFSGRELPYTATVPRARADRGLPCPLCRHDAVGPLPANILRPGTGHADNT